MQSAVKLDDYRNSKLQSEKGFIDFVSDNEKSENVENFLAFKNLVVNGKVKELHDFFNNLGYSVPFEECQKMIDNKNIVKKLNENSSYAY